MKEFTGTIVCNAGMASLTDLAIAFPGSEFRVEFATRIEGRVFTATFEEVRFNRDPHSRVYRYIVTNSILSREETKSIVNQLYEKKVKAWRAPFIAKYGSLIEAVAVESRRDEYGDLIAGFSKYLPEIHIEASMDFANNCALLEIYGPEGWTRESMSKLYSERWNAEHVECPTCGAIHRKNN